MSHSLVIPAKAGIQLVEQFSRSEAKFQFCSLRELVFLLDSRFRGNDEITES